ncbi:hypothetical protein PQX77_001663 [Marasmius sp. AFHP31]|nr:hypothetical protein PQX77_001663 [Marasmius sp. AFHP31]
MSSSRTHLMDSSTPNSTSSYSASMQMLTNESEPRDSAQTQTAGDIETQPGRYWSHDRKERTQSRDSSTHSPEPQAPSGIQSSDIAPRDEEEHEEALHSDGDSRVIPTQLNDNNDQRVLDARLEFMAQRIARLEAEQWAPPPGYSRE